MNQPQSSTFKSLWHGLLDAVLPPLCLVCQTPVAATQSVCAGCWQKLNFIAAPFCTGCGVPFSVPAFSGSQCGACIQEPPQYTAARAALVYDDASRALILGFKHADHTYAAPALARWMQRAAPDLLTETTIIAPVPLHYFRLLRRRYNQAAMLGQQIARDQGKIFTADLLIRTRATPPQGHLHRKERANNVRGAFKLNPRHAPFVQNRNILLVDDVLTTGATAGECAKILQQAGAGKVFVLTLARVTRAE